MRPVGKEFLIRRRTLGERGIERDGVAFHRRVDEPGGGAHVVERALAPASESRAALRLHAHLIVAHAELHAHRLEDRFLEEKHRVHPRGDRRHKRLFAERGEIAVLRLVAEHALERPELFMRQLETSVVAFVLKFRPGQRALKLRVLVVRNAEAVFHRLHVRERREKRAAKIPAALLHVDRHSRLGHGAVVRVETGIRQPEEAALPDVGRAAGQPLGAEIAVRQHVTRFLFPRRQGLQPPQPRGSRETGDVQFVRRAFVAIDVPDESTHAAFQHEGPAALAVHRPGAPLDAPAHGRADPLVRDAPVEHVHHAADGVRPVEQRRRAAHHLDALHAHGIETHCVIHTRRRGIQRVVPVL